MDYQDRILFGTDVVMRRAPSALAPAEGEQVLADLETVYQTHFAYLESTGQVTVRGITNAGLGLPQDVLDKVYHTNALAWYPHLNP